MLDYGKEYYVTMDKGVIEGFEGIKKGSWRFRMKNEVQSTKNEEQSTKNVPSGWNNSSFFIHHSSFNVDKLITVAADGTGDFCTLQGALDYVPDFAKSEAERWTIFVKNGEYEEILCHDCG